MKPAQKEKVKQFINLTHTSEQTAFLCLSTHGWKLDVATDSYYTNPGFIIVHSISKLKIFINIFLIFKIQLNMPIIKVQLVHHLDNQIQVQNVKK